MMKPVAVVRNRKELESAYATHGWMRGMDRRVDRIVEDVRH
jgi:hypothetical protein